MLGGGKHVVIRDAHQQQGVGNDALVIQQRFFLGELCRAQCRADLPALVNGLENLDICIPALVLHWRRREKRKLFNCLGVKIVAVDPHARQRDGARLHDDAVLRFEVALAAQDLAVLLHAEVSASAIESGRESQGGTWPVVLVCSAEARMSVNVMQVTRKIVLRFIINTRLDLSVLVQSEIVR